MNVSKGDLAYISDSNWPENPNNGAVVEVVRLVFHTVPAWFCKCKTPLKDIYGIKVANEGIVGDCDLRRIAGPGIKIDAETEQPVNDEVPA
jgi:hypothetical protein